MWDAGALLRTHIGTGSFLVRPYALKKELSGRKLAHENLLQQIKGIDISAYAAHLATINLATRDLIDERNYPLVARSDFFQSEIGRNHLLHPDVRARKREADGPTRNW